MTPRLRIVVVVLALAAAGAVRAESIPPRDLWPQATNAALNGNLDSATRHMAELTTTGKSYGLKTFPLYAESAAGLARQAEKIGNKDLAAWATRTAEQLDPKSPAVAFSNADRFAGNNDWARAVPAAFTGLARVATNYRTRVLSQSDLLIVIACALALTAALFAIALFIRYGRSMAHDFREILGQRFRGGSVSVLAFALLFLPIFLWLGPMWLVLYWFAIFFGYANGAERTLILILALLFAATPLILDRAATWTAGVESPVVMAAIASNEQSYQPQALRRMQDLAAVVPDNPVIHLLLGNLNLFEGNEPQAAVHYRRSVELRDTAGAHVNLGNLHFFDNDFPAAITQYKRAQELDPNLAIAFYNNSVAAGETYKFDEQGKMLGAAKAIDRTGIEALQKNPPAQKVVIYRPSLAEAWRVQTVVAKRANARSQFGNYTWFDPAKSVLNPVTIGGLLAFVLAIVLWLKRRRTGYAGSCIKCGRTFCHRCKSARESATYCTQCIHIYLKRDGVSLATKRAKVEEVSDHQSGMLTRNRFFATFLPGSAQVLEGRTVTGVIGMFLFLTFVVVAVLTGRLAPALGPVAETAQLIVRIIAIALAAITWFMLSLPVYRRKAPAA